ncbi:LPXTG cell wall anchor domain-containing protein [Levilactobacillus parabrevis]|uniref:LPXTG cell wall anchor domain-containing protein n=1 Tax=Levilactobacillus parabrevis TaxID=357278 RepID=UPI0021A6EB43|nr:LPXTG cell wall anchor domain-containing protein [Levilactobacillus parabrevis]MCT4488740.1 LPXTG cell wall anchor domain-containing protein [Levilactobacillus parabrevis]MCT4490937.1 LPXTG cell wall anchor domain-containing protein [Levilactobacillus parabrevis]
MAGKARLPESGGQRASSMNVRSTQVRPVTASTLPQTDDQQSVWQWLGIVLLAGLGWLGLGRRKHQN